MSCSIGTGEEEGMSQACKHISSGHGSIMRLLNPLDFPLCLTYTLMKSHPMAGMVNPRSVAIESLLGILFLILF
jgi:hypothetical protein